MPKGLTVFVTRNNWKQITCEEGVCMDGQDETTPLLLIYHVPSAYELFALHFVFCIERRSKPASVDHATSAAQKAAVLAVHHKEASVGRSLLSEAQLNALHQASMAQPAAWGTLQS
eukprot:1157930-Pelagomonas_calceolata.AAC.2